MTLTGIIVALIMLLLGFLLGWFIEWRIDLAYSNGDCQRSSQVCRENSMQAIQWGGSFATDPLFLKIVKDWIENDGEAYAMFWFHQAGGTKHLWLFDSFEQFLSIVAGFMAIDDIRCAAKSGTSRRAAHAKRPAFSGRIDRGEGFTTSLTLVSRPQDALRASSVR